LVERGAAAGAATTRAVFGETAGRVGCNWARLLAHGWSIERALDVARSVDDPAGYVAVGDGTHFLTEPGDRAPLEYRLEESEGTKEIEMNANTPVKVGTRIPPDLSGQQQLSSTVITRNLMNRRVQRMLPILDYPIITKEALYWNADQFVKD
jgi:hypothetical protein